MDKKAITNPKELEMRAKAQKAILDFLSGDYDFYYCDMDSWVFAELPFENYAPAAKRLVDEFGRKEVVNKVLEWELETSGETLLDKNPKGYYDLHLINTLWYIIGQEVIEDMCAFSPTLVEEWNSKSTKGLNERIIEEVKDMDTSRRWNPTPKH